MPEESSFLAVPQGEQDGSFSIAVVPGMPTAHLFCWVWLQERGEILVIDSSWMTSLLGNGGAALGNKFVSYQCLVKTQSSHRTTLTSVAFSAFYNPQVDRKMGSKDLWRCWLRGRKNPFSPAKTGRQSKMVCWATGKIDLCVTVSFCEQAKVFWHKTHDIYSQKCGINCYHPDFFNGNIFCFLVTIVLSLSHCQERDCPAVWRAWQETVVGPGRECHGNVQPMAALNEGSSLPSLWKSHLCPNTKVCLH